MSFEIKITTIMKQFYVSSQQTISILKKLVENKDYIGKKPLLSTDGVKNFKNLLKFELCLQEYRRQQFQINTEYFYKNISEFEYKIKNYCSRYEFNYSEIIEEIKTNIHLAIFFIPDPLKQNIAEKLQFIFLQDMFPGIVKSHSIYITPTEIISKKTKVSTKSMDFYDANSNSYFYAKYIKSEGGAQDNQYADLLQFISISKQLLKSGCEYKFYVVISGEYFKKKNK